MLYQLSYWPTTLRATPGEPGWLPGFPMQRMRTAVPAELLVLDAIRMQAPVLIRCVVAAIALTTGQSDEVPGHMFPCPSPNTKAGAHDRTRTGDLLLTKEVLYRLSYMGPKRLRASALRRPRSGAGNGIRTRDIQLGRLTL